MVELVGRFVELLAELVETRDHGGARLVGVDLDIVADGVARPKADDRLCGEAFVRDDAGEQRLRVDEELLCLGADHGIV